MPKRRFQQGCIRIVGCQYVLYFWRDECRNGEVQRVKVSRLLGPISLSKRAARKLAQPILNLVNNPQVEIPVRDMNQGITLGEFILEWRKCGMIDFKPSTRRSMESSIRAHVLPVLGEFQLSRIEAHNVQDRINSLQGRSRGTHENVVSAVLRILEEARKIHAAIPVINKPDLKFGIEKPGEGRPLVFAPTQVKAILKAFAGRKPWDVFFTVLAGSGLRASEILDLRVEDLDFENNLIHNRQAAGHGIIQTPKTPESENSVPMTQLMKQRLREHLVNHTHELVFVNRLACSYSRNKIVHKVLHPTLGKLGISRKGKRVGLHGFRHCLASMLLQTTGAAVAQRQLRHADPAKTLGIYGHILGTDHVDAIERIQALLSDPIGT